MKIFFVFLFILILATSCDNKEKTKQKTLDVPTEKTEEKVVKRLIFEIDLETTKPDEFRLFSNDIFLNNNQFMDLGIKQKLNSNETSKKMVYKFPEGVTPDFNLGFSLGRKSLKKVTLKKIKISFGNNLFEIKPKEVEDYFFLNKFIDFNPETGVIQTKKVDGKHNPVMLFKQKALNKLIGS